MRTYANTQREKPYPSPWDERENLLNILWGINVSIPGANIKNPSHPSYIEMDHLRDMVDWQVEKVASEPEFNRGHMSEEALDGFREYARWRELKGRGELHFSVPGIPGLGAKT
jgi:hypothetical protein